MGTLNLNLRDSYLCRFSDRDHWEQFIHGVLNLSRGNRLPVGSSPDKLIFVPDPLYFTILPRWDIWVKQCNTALVSEWVPPLRLLHQCFHRILNDLSKRYSGGIPQGTAVPHWAFYNVTVRDLHAFNRLRVDVQSSCRPMVSLTTTLLKPPGVSVAQRSKLFGFLITTNISGDPEANPTPPRTSVGPNGPSSTDRIAAVVGGQSRILVSSCYSVGLKFGDCSCGRWGLPTHRYIGRIHRLSAVAQEQRKGHSRATVLP